MNPREVADVFGVLVTAGLAVTVVGAVAAAISPAARRRILGSLGGSGAVLAAGVALLATAGSLWFSESAGFPPCDLCWYQRIAMYPLPVVLGIAGVGRSRTGRITGLILALAGLAVSIWHNLQETFPSLDAGSCDPMRPCTVRWVEGLGFWTIPRMAAACFIVVVAMCMLDLVADNRRTTHES